jgi:hypothetical protein
MTLQKEKQRSSGKVKGARHPQSSWPCAPLIKTPRLTFRCLALLLIRARCVPFPPTKQLAVRTPLQDISANVPLPSATLVTCVPFEPTTTILLSGQENAVSHQSPRAQFCQQTLATIVEAHMRGAMKAFADLGHLRSLNVYIL